MKLNPLSLVMLLLAAAAAPAQQPARLEPVVVTATLRPGPVDRRPGGVTVLAGDAVHEAGVVHLEELLPQLPSLSWAGASSRPRYFQLRGIGELEQYQGAPNPSIGFLVDEIDFSGIGMIASLFDVEQVEVLRGPQGTRYGANALGGLIKLKTRDPVPDQELDTEISLGDDGLWSAGLAAGGALGAAKRVARVARARGQRRIPREPLPQPRRYQRARRDYGPRQIPGRGTGCLARGPRAALRGLRQRLRRVRDRQQPGDARRTGRGGTPSARRAPRWTLCASSMAARRCARSPPGRTQTSSRASTATGATTATGAMRAPTISSPPRVAIA